jgi:hypothetical protein
MSPVNERVRSCYSQYKVPGIATVKIEIAAGGRVARVTVRGKFDGTPTGVCVRNAVQTAQFPRCQAQSIDYPFSLR